MELGPVRRTLRFNSPTWKQIAKAAAKVAASLPNREKGAVFAELLSQEPKSSSYDPRLVRN